MKVSTSVPCQYWYNNAWYNVIPLDAKGLPQTSPPMYKATQGSTNAYYQICKPLNSNTDVIDSTTIPNTCDADVLKSYAALVTSSNTCSAMSTDNLSSVSMMKDGFTGANYAAGLNVPSTNSTLGIEYTTGDSNVCSL